MNKQRKPVICLLSIWHLSPNCFIIYLNWKNVRKETRWIYEGTDKTSTPPQES